jgi:hypothetical protein
MELPEETVADVTAACGGSRVRCLEDPERSAAEGYELADVQRMFTKRA